MAKLQYSTLETADQGTLSKLGIFNKNWRKIEALLNPTLSATDPTYGALFGAIQRAINGQKDPSEVLTPVTNAITVDMTAGACQQVEFSANLSVSLSNTQNGRTTRLMLKNTSGSSKTVTWPASNFSWADTAMTSVGAGKWAWVDLQQIYDSGAPSTPLTLARGSVAP